MSHHRLEAGRARALTFYLKEAAVIAHSDVDKARLESEAGSLICQLNESTSAWQSRKAGRLMDIGALLERRDYSDAAWAFLRGLK